MTQTITHLRSLADVRATRAALYPPLEELADALYWQAQGDPSKLADYLAKCEAVKLKNPKPAPVGSPGGKGDGHA